MTFIDNNSPFSCTAREGPTASGGGPGVAEQQLRAGGSRRGTAGGLTPEEEKQLKVDEWHMHCALHLASSAAAEEVPVGAVLLAPNGTVLARAHNMV